VAGAFIGLLLVLGPKHSKRLVKLLVPVAEKVWCLWPGIRLGGIEEKGAFEGFGTVAERCCLVRTSAADH
jgi:hypothetical protein